MSKIRVRTATGHTFDVDDGSFVEVCDDEGSIACVVYRANTGEVRVIMPGDDRHMDHYSKLFDVEFCKEVVDVEQTVNNGSAINV